MADDYPIFLLDVDGVLNCFPEGPSDDMLTFRAGNGFQINTRTRVVAWLQQIALERRVDIRWLTTWEHEANHFLSPRYNVREFRVQSEFRDHPTFAVWWKLQAVQNLLNEEPGRRVIWVDDDIRHDYPALDFIEARHSEDIFSLLAISPDTTYGITDEHMLLIDRFISREHQAQVLRDHAAHVRGGRHDLSRDS